MRSVWRNLFSERYSGEPFSPANLLLPLQQAFERLDPDSDLALHKRWQPELVRALWQLELPGWLISELISDHNDWLYRMAIDASMAEMRDEGWGEAPVGFCVLVMGSGGRHESLLHPDQDNALILENYPPERHGEIDTWFRTLADRFTGRLNDAGIPFCRGYVMASMPLWRKPVDEWAEQMRIWMGTRRVKLVQQCNILFDFAPVYGDAALADQLREAIFAQVPKAGLFLHEMAELFDEAPVALDRFDRLQGDGRDAPHSHAVNLKRQGLLPLTAALRLLALTHDCREVGTRDRLDRLEQVGVLEPGMGQSLKAVFGRLMERLLASQMAALASRGKPDNWIDIRQLSEPEWRQLQADLKQIQSLQKRSARNL